ncbi:MAG: protein-glutamine glutaminase family protein [Polyangiales bacterium]
MKNLRITQLVIACGLGGCAGDVAAPEELATYALVAEAAPCEVTAPLGFDAIKGPVENISPACVPTWTAAQLTTAFAAIRDTRWLSLMRQPGISRRIPWLSVLNGCEERALAARYFLLEQGYPLPYFARAAAKPRKQLSMVTDNEPSGRVSWSAHVAPVVQVDGQLVVLDPAINPYTPLLLRDWLGAFVSAADADVGICRDHEAGSGCFEAQALPPEHPLRGEPWLGIALRLEEEWRVQELLGRDPLRALGECPPWVQCATPEPVADPSRAPRIRRFLSEQGYDDYVGGPVFVIGDNFVPGVTTLHVSGEAFDAELPIINGNLRRLYAEPDYPAGTYYVTAANGAWVSEPALWVVP